MPKFELVGRPLSDPVQPVIEDARPLASLIGVCEFHANLENVRNARAAE
jgi:hypothetical protein